MTDQPKPDPQYVDGLSREQIMEYIRELNTIAANCEVAGTAEFSRSAHNLYRIANRWFKSLPTPDAAEGAVAMIARGPDWTPDNPAIAAMFADEREDWRTDLHKRGADRDLERRTITLHADASPPKPAPDAMRKLRIALEPVNVEVRVRERLVNNGRNAANGNVGMRTGSDLHLCEMLIGQLDRAREAFTELAALAAPVPSPDGAGKTIINVIRALGPPDPSDEEFEHGWAACNAAVVDILTELGFPSATGAAEPVTWNGVVTGEMQDAFDDALPRRVDARHPNDRDKPLYNALADGDIFTKAFRAALALATPPVRGDREIADITRSIRIIESAYDFESTGIPIKNCGEWKYLRRLLSLPVQPGAGEGGR